MGNDKTCACGCDPRDAMEDVRADSGRVTVPAQLPGVFNHPVLGRVDVGMEPFAKADEAAIDRLTKAESCPSVIRRSHVILDKACAVEVAVDRIRLRLTGEAHSPVDTGVGPLGALGSSERCLDRVLGLLEDLESRLGEL